MCYSPVRHSLSPKKECVRLACVRHAASVYPEPGSNSPFMISTTARLASNWKVHAVELRSRPNCCRCYCCIWLFAETHMCISPSGLMADASIDRNCVNSSMLHSLMFVYLPVCSVLLSTLQLSRYWCFQSPRASCSLHDCRCSIA